MGRGTALALILVMRNLRLLFATAAFALLATACATDGDDADADGGGKSDGAGTNGSIGYIQSNSPFYWADSDYATFQSSVGLTDRTPIADTEALTQRLQSWVDKLDTMVRSEMKRTAGITLVTPKPVVKVLPSGSTFNAWVSGTYACTGLQRPGATDPTTVSLLRANQVYSEQLTCVRPTWPGVTELLTFWNRNKPACKLSTDGTIAGTGCEISPNPPGEVAIISTSPYIHVTSDLLATADEATIVVVLAHELGHYYRSHVSDARVAKYDFWFDSEIDRKKRPVPAANAADLAKQYDAIVNGPGSIQAHVGGRYSPRLRSFIIGAVSDLLAERTEAGFVCAGARDALGPWRDSLRNSFGTPSDQIQDYLAFEVALAACAPRLDLTGTPGASSLSYGQVLMAVMEGKLGKVTLPFRATLADVLNALNTNATKLDAKEASLLAHVKQNRIGLYTTEEEADDLAMEFAARIGISPDQVMQAWLRFMQQIVGAVPPEYRAQYQAEYDSCKVLFDNGFTTTDAAGKKIAAFVPIGNLSEPHHSDCYRLFNFWRNKKLRKYTVAPAASFGGWEPLQAEAQRLSAEAASNGL